ncbi:MAG: TrkH family potassium uptake protein [Planctomycetota bacterium]
MKRPEVLLPITFLVAIVVGTGLLLLPGMASERVGLLEAFFTATSAVCVTGLVVVDTGTDFTASGQAVILGLIQLGGLGIMTFSVLALVLAGRRVRLDQETAVKESFTSVATMSLGRLLVTIIAVTLLLEAVGFLALDRALDDTWSAAFHSVSAFCNAGFSLYSQSLQGRGAGVMFPILFLLVLGGLGFTTLLELGKNLWWRRHKRRRFTLHARLVFLTSILLWGGGTLLLTATEGGHLRNAVFMSASARTAGFETTPVGELSGASLLILIPLMFVGASPGSTGGGIKTTTLAIAVLVARATLRGSDRIVVSEREIPRGLVRRMFAVVFCSVLVIFLAIFLLHVFEGGRADTVLAYAFEAVSAFCTVGLSTGVTPDLTIASKVLLCVVMFVGRVGSLSFFILLVRDAPASHVRYPEERIHVG